MLQLHMTHQDAKLGIHNTLPFLSLRTSDPAVKLSVKQAQMEIHQPEGILKIDQHPCRYSMGYKNVAEFNRDNAKAANEHALAAIAEISRIGVQLSRIEDKGNTVVNLIKGKLISQPGHLTLKHIASPNISYTPQGAKISVQPGKVNVELQEGTVKGEFQPGKAQVYMAQDANLHVWFTDDSSSALDISV